MKKIAVDSFLQFKFVSNPSFSPDGKYVAFIVSYANKASNDYKADIHLLETETGKVRQLTNGGDAKAYCWTDKGTLLFAAPRCPKVKKRLEKGENVILVKTSPGSGGTWHFGAALNDCGIFEYGTVK